MSNAAFKINHEIAFKVTEGDELVPVKGYIVRTSEEWLTVALVEGGVARFPQDEILKPTVSKQPIPVDARIVELSTPEVEPKKYDHAAGAKAPKVGSKQYLVSKLYAEHHNTKTRSEIIQLIMDEVNMTKAGAGTYYQNAKKASEVAS